MSKIYDDIFRTLCEKNTKLLIPVINEVFSTKYKITEEMELLSGEHHILSGKEQNSIGEIITDSLIRLAGKFYHIECQSNPDGTIILRMVEYDFHIALENVKKTEEGYEINFPYSAVLYLRHTGRTPDKIEMKVNFQNGESINYSVPVIKVQKYNYEEIIQKDLFLLIPYYIMRYENKTDEEIMPYIKKEYEELYNGISKAYNNDILNSYDMTNIIEFTEKLVHYIFNNNKNICKEVDKVMGGQVLETYADKKLKQGMQQGMQQGIQQGMQQGIQQGMQQGVQLMAQLSVRLAEDGKISEISRAATDSAYMDKLLKEYKISR